MREKLLKFWGKERVILLGHGKTMQQLGEILAPCDIYDDKFSEIFSKKNCRFLPSSEITKIPQDARDSTLSIISPGIPPHSILAQNAPNVISEYDFFSPVMPRSVWISGTNGKTTTTEMTGVLLREFVESRFDSSASADSSAESRTESAELRAQSPKILGEIVGGNIGTPLCALDSNAPLWILETSSFMLHYTNRAKPDIYALLPVTDDHLSWHGDFAAYECAKLKPLLMMGEESVAIIPQIYAQSPQAAAFKGRLYAYENALDLARIFGIEMQRLRFKGAFLLDSVLALAICSLLAQKIDYEKINAFKIGAHKIEEFRDAQGRLFVDDSKATNISAAREALEIYREKFIFLILGGDNKGVSLAPLVESLVRYRVKVFAIGVCAAHIKELCDDSSVPCEVCGDLQNALDKIKREFKDAQDEVCLLSPACASLDQFSSYKHRGEEFQRIALG